MEFGDTTGQGDNQEISWLTELQEGDRRIYHLMLSYYPHALFPLLSLAFDILDCYITAAMGQIQPSRKAEVPSSQKTDCYPCIFSAAPTFVQARKKHIFVDQATTRFTLQW